MTRSKGASRPGAAAEGQGPQAVGVIAGRQCLPVLLDDGTRKYVWGLGLAYAVDSSGSPLVYHSDGLGSVRALTDSAGSIVQTYLYDEYGVVLSRQGTVTQPFGYTGEQRDGETGLVYLRARMYDPASGRFTGRDAKSGKADVPETLNRYAYVGDNPILGTDPSGYGMIVPCKARSGGIKDDATASTGSSLSPCDMPPVVLAASSAGPASILAYVGFGVLQVATRAASTPMGRAIDSLKGYISTGQGSWRLSSVHVEDATSEIYTKLGARFSMEQIFSNAATGERLGRHITYNAEKIFEDTFRDVAKFGAP